MYINPITMEDIYPIDFNFKDSEKTVIENAKNSDELINCRKYILECRAKYVKANRDYFIINFIKPIKYSNIVRDIIMKEVLQRFPHIGYKYAMIQEMVIFGIPMGPPETITKIMRLTGKEQFYHEDVYVVALTQNFAKNMETYLW